MARGSGALAAAALAAALVGASRAAAPPTCGALKVGEAFPASKAMEASVQGSFKGDAAACCQLCSANEQCGAITWFKVPTLSLLAVCLSVSWI